MIKIPLHLCLEKMKDAGERAWSMEWSDVQLGEQISALRLVVNYLEGRGDCQLVVKTLRIELLKFEDFKYCRENYDKEHLV